jgi:hypothetical protein
MLLPPWILECLVVNASSARGYRTLDKVSLDVSRQVAWYAPAPWRLGLRGLQLLDLADYGSEDSADDSEVLDEGVG